MEHAARDIPARSYRTLTVAASTIVVAAVIVAAFAPHRAASAADTPFTGWFWSNAGWISLNCSTDPGGCSGLGGSWGVHWDSSTGYFSGWAWSDNLGWIKFGGLSGFPGGRGTTADNLKFSSGALTGWIRACGGTVSGDCSGVAGRTDGWDGWISFNGIASDGSPYQVTANPSGGFNSCAGGSSCAWGSDVVGWVDASSAQFQCAAQPAQCGQNGIANDLCTFDTNSCSWSCSRCAFQCASGACIAAPGPQCNIQLGGGMSACIKASPTVIASGADAQVFWNVNNVQNDAKTGVACTVAGGASQPTWTTKADKKGNAAASGQSNPIGGPTTFTLTCEGLDGTLYHWTAAVGLAPSFRER